MKLRILGASMAVCLMFGSAALAVPTVIIGTDDDDPIPDTVFSRDFFSDLAGASVTFGSQSGASTAGTWIAGDGNWGAGAGCGGVNANLPSGFGYTLGGCGDTFTETWELLNGSGDGLLTVEIDLRPVPDHFFDRTDPSTGTPGSARGRDFEYVSSTMPGIDGTINITYSFPGQTPPNASPNDPRNEDLYAVMLIDFTGLTNTAGANQRGLIDDTVLVFRQDTDPDTMSPIPLPAGAWLLLTGGAALVTLRRRKAS
jgi:hypothetical protein